MIAFAKANRKIHNSLTPRYKQTMNMTSERKVKTATKTALHLRLPELNS